MFPSSDVTPGRMDMSQLRDTPGQVFSGSEVPQVRCFPPLMSSQIRRFLAPMSPKLDNPQLLVSPQVGRFPALMFPKLDDSLHQRHPRLDNSQLRCSQSWTIPSSGVTPGQTFSSSNVPNIRLFSAPMSPQVGCFPAFGDPQDERFPAPDGLNMRCFPAPGDPQGQTFPGFDVAPKSDVSQLPRSSTRVGCFPALMSPNIRCFLPPTSPQVRHLLSPLLSLFIGSGVPPGRTVVGSDIRFGVGQLLCPPRWTFAGAGAFGVCQFQYRLLLVSTSPNICHVWCPPAPGAAGRTLPIPTTPFAVHPSRFPSLSANFNVSQLRHFPVPKIASFGARLL
ncbi:uncharacterized protein [Struthio camelus]|uniref:uncharacterized protein n=1 Tax=Struthio camelus TaxID=8801 RepID=UPI003603C240